MIENELQLKISNRLKTWFNVYPEYKTLCKTGRIDFIIECKITKALFGLEIKKIDKKKGNDMGLLIKQAHRYSNSCFTFNNVTQKIPIFIFPALSYDYLICPEKMIIVEGEEYFKDRHTKDFVHHTIQGFIGVWNVGELRVYKEKENTYIRFVFNNQEIWTNEPQWNNPEIKGLHKENYNKLITRINDSNCI
jgi:hypothetical protein